MKIVELFPLRSVFFYVRECPCDTIDVNSLAADHLHLLAYEENGDGRITRFWFVASAEFLDGIHESPFSGRTHRRVDPRSIQPGVKSRDYLLSAQTWTPPAGRPPKLLARLERATYKPRVIPGRFRRFLSAVRALFSRISRAS